MNQSSRLKQISTKFFFGIVIIVFFLVIFFHFSEWSQVIKILDQGIWYWLLVAIILEFAYFANQAQIFSQLYKFYKFPSNFKILVNLFLSANFVNLATPTAGFSGMFVFASFGRKLGVRRTNSFIINGLFYLLHYGIFAVILAMVLLYLFYKGDLRNYQLICASILFGIIIFSLIIMVISGYSKSNLHRFFKYSAKLVNFFPRLFGKKIITFSKSYSIEEEIYVSLRYFLVSNAKKIGLPIFFALVGHIIQILLLYVLFLSFNFQISFIPLLIGYAIGILFLLISFTPSGLGIVEPTMTLTFVSFGVPLAVSGLVVMIFRAITFWLPFLLGFFSFNWLKNVPDIEAPLKQLSKK